jgi:oxygen-independent coproporphyrinogen-3 oxidase
MIKLDQIPDAEPTEVGSYFIANYPPFSAWKPAHVPAVIEALDKPAQTSAPLGLYLHIPFCRKRCTFCYFRVYTDKNAGEIDDYMDALAKEVALYADKPALAGRQFEFVYFGGGTPSYLSSQQLERLIERINRHWSWSAAKEVTFECEPGTLQKHKLETIKKIGVTRLSLGVEHFDDEILAGNGRAHKSPEIYRAWDWIREVGFPQVNIDLIAGMVGETDDKWKMAVEQALKFAPDSVTIYQMELPFNTVISREARDTGAPAPVANWATKRRWVGYAFKEFEAAGYKVSSGYTLAKPSDRSSFVYRDSLWHGADLIGMGVASFSHFAGVHYQNEDQWEGYTSRLDTGELPIARALPVTPHQRLIREFILQLKTGRVDAAYFANKFGENPLALFRDQLADLAAHSLAEIGSDTIHLSREGLLQVDALLPRFFEREYLGIRYT